MLEDSLPCPSRLRAPCRRGGSEWSLCLLVLGHLKGAGVPRGHRTGHRGSDGPHAHDRSLAANLPTATAHIAEGEGHSLRPGGSPRAAARSAANPGERQKLALVAIGALPHRPATHRRRSIQATEGILGSHAPRGLPASALPVAHSPRSPSSAATSSGARGSTSGRKRRT